MQRNFQDRHLPKGRFGPRRTYALQIIGKHAVVGLAVLGLATGAVQGAAIKDLSLEPAHNLLGDLPGTLWVQGYYNNNAGTQGYYHVSSFPVGKQIDQSGTTLKTFFYLPLHTYAEDPFASIVAVGGGTNWMSNPGLLFENLHEEYRSPLWNPSSPDSTAGDFSIWSTTTAVPDSWIHELAPLGSVLEGDIAFEAGFGRLSTPATGVLPATGDSYGFYGKISNAVGSNVQDGTYKSTSFNATNNFVAYQGAGNPGDSGSWVLDSQNRLIGAAVAGQGGYNDVIRSTDFADFTAPAFASQLAPYAGVTVVPEPGTCGLLLAGLALLLVRPFRRCAR